MPMDFLPTQLGLLPDGRLQVAWNDGQTRDYTIRELREHCPCASCREKHAAPAPPPMQLPVLSAAEMQPLKLTAMQPVGNYAYSLHFSDGHDTGIYTLELLRALGKVHAG